LQYRLYITALEHIDHYRDGSLSGALITRKVTSIKCITLYWSSDQRLRLEGRESPGDVDLKGRVLGKGGRREMKRGAVDKRREGWEGADKHKAAPPDDHTSGHCLSLAALRHVL
jgi:hypothetical protein